MNRTRYNAVSPRPKKDGGVWWQNVGLASMNDKGQISVQLSAYPLPDEDGNVRIMLFERTDDDERRSAQPSSSNLDDEIPF